MEAKGREEAMMMEVVRTSETSVNINLNTRRYIPEDSKHHTRRSENLKSLSLDLPDKSILQQKQTRSSTQLQTILSRK
jgi:hypothetical protein